MSRAKQVIDKCNEALGHKCKEELKAKAQEVLTHLKKKFGETNFSVNPVQSAGNGLPSFVRISTKSGKFFEEPFGGLRRKFPELNFTIETRKKEGSMTSSVLVSMSNDNRPLRAKVKIKKEIPNV